jgi:hypothetical protein
MTLLRTWFLGFHSLRQILYGSLLGVVANVLLVESVIINKNNKNYPVIMLMFGSVSSFVVFLQLGKFPFEWWEISVGSISLLFTVINIFGLSQH